MMLASEAVQADGTINKRYSCDGDNISPPLTFSDIPEGTQSLVFVLDDPDADAVPFVHWLLYDMSPATLQIVEGDTPVTGSVGLNDFGMSTYGGPCPPPDATHTYVFTLTALDVALDLPSGVGRDELAQAMEGHVIESASIEGMFHRTTP